MTGKSDSTVWRCGCVFSVRDHEPVCCLWHWSTAIFLAPKELFQRFPCVIESRNRARHRGHKISSVSQSQCDRDDSAFWGASRRNGWALVFPGIPASCWTGGHQADSNISVWSAANHLVLVSSHCIFNSYPFPRFCHWNLPGVTLCLKCFQCEIWHYNICWGGDAFLQHTFLILVEMCCVEFDWI